MHSRTVSLLVLFTLLLNSVGMSFADCLPIQNLKQKEIFVLSDFSPNDESWVNEKPTIDKFCKKTSDIPNIVNQCIEQTKSLPSVLETQLASSAACTSASTSSRSEIQDFNELSGNILNEDNYKFLFLNDEEQEDYDHFIDEFSDIQKRIDIHKKNKKESISGRNIDRTKNVTQYVVLEGPLGSTGKLVGKGIDAILHKARAVLRRNQNHEKIELEKILPANSKKIALVRGATGGLMVLIGVGGVIAGVLTLGSSGIITGPMGAGAAIAGHLVERTASGSKHDREDYFHEASDTRRRKKISTSSAKVGAQSMDQAIEHVGYHEGSHAMQNDFEASGGIGTKSLMVLPILGSIYQITNGVKKVYQSYKGFEKGHEFLLAHETNYQRLTNTYLENSKKTIEAVLTLAKGLSEKKATGNDPLHFASQINCLCNALEWVDQFQRKAELSFQNRIKYLKKRVERKEKRKAILERILGNQQEKNFNTTLKEIDDFSNELENQNNELEVHYQTLSGGQSISENPRYDELISNLIPRLTSENSGNVTDRKTSMEWNTLRLSALDAVNSFLIAEVSRQVEKKLAQRHSSIVVDQLIAEEPVRNYEIETTDGNPASAHVKFKSYLENLKKNKGSQKRDFKTLQKKLKKLDSRN